MKPCNIMSCSCNCSTTSCLNNAELIDNDNLILKSSDPLEVSDKIENKYYRLDCVVFAEPLEYQCKRTNGTDTNTDDQKNDGAKEDELTVIDKVLVQKRTGKKYKKYHITIEDPSNLCCPQSNCDKKFPTTKLLKAHIRKVHCADKSSYMCDVCGSAFSCRYLLVRHSAVHGGGSVQCNVCSMRLSKRTSLSAHLRTHSGIKPHTCTTCKKQFSRKSTLDTHVKFVHRAEWLQCTKCPNRFETRSQWTRHMTTHKNRQQDGAPTS